MTDDLGRVPLAPGCEPSASAADGVFAESHPSRVLAGMARYLADAKDAGLTPCMWHLAEPIAKSLSKYDERPALIFGLPISVHDEWTWGWMLRVKPAAYSLDRDTYFWNPTRDSDANLADQEVGRD